MTKALRAKFSYQNVQIIKAAFAALFSSLSLNSGGRANRQSHSLLESPLISSSIGRTSIGNPLVALLKFPDLIRWWGGLLPLTLPGRITSMFAS